MSDTHNNDGRPATPLYDQTSGAVAPDSDTAYAPPLGEPFEPAVDDAPIAETYTNAPYGTGAGDTTGGSTSSTDAGGSGKADTAKEEAASVAGDAKQSAQQVAGTTKEQAGKVASEAAGQAKQLFGQATSELKDQAGAQQEKAAAGLRSVGQQLSSMADGADSGVAQELVNNLSGRAHGVAEWLEGRDPGSLLAGRVVKSLTAEAKEAHDSSASDTTSTTPTTSTGTPSHDAPLHTTGTTGTGPVAGEYDVITEGDVPGLGGAAAPSSSTPSTWPVQGEARP
jgi:hypothetical protein